MGKQQPRRQGTISTCQSSSDNSYFPPATDRGVGSYLNAAMAVHLITAQHPTLNRYPTTTHPPTSNSSVEYRDENHGMPVPPMASFNEKLHVWHTWAGSTASGYDADREPHVKFGPPQDDYTGTKGIYSRPSHEDSWSNPSDAVYDNLRPMNYPILGPSNMDVNTSGFSMDTCRSVSAQEQHMMDWVPNRDSPSSAFDRFTNPSLLNTPTYTANTPNLTPYECGAYTARSSLPGRYSPQLAQPLLDSSFLPQVTHLHSNSIPTASTAISRTNSMTSVRSAVEGAHMPVISPHASLDVNLTVDRNIAAGQPSTCSSIARTDEVLDPPATQPVKRPRGRPRKPRPENPEPKPKKERISRRQPHNLIERKYRENLNGAMNTLREAVYAEQPGYGHPPGEALHVDTEGLQFADSDDSSPTAETAQEAEAEKKSGAGKEKQHNHSKAALILTAAKMITTMRSENSDLKSQLQEMGAALEAIQEKLGEVLVAKDQQAGGLQDPVLLPGEDPGL